MTPVDWHPSDEDLTLHAYRDNSPEERTAVDRHLADCAGCAATWREIDGLLRLASSADVPDPGDRFEADVWTRLVPHLSSPRRTWALRHVMAVSGWAAAVAALVVAGHLWMRQVPAANPASPRIAAADATPATADAAADARERVLLTALDQHFSQTEMLFVELLNAPDDADSSLEFERATADDLVQSGRLYRATAAQAGDGRLTDVLDDVQTVLTEVARGPETASPGGLAAIRARITHDDLLFKVRAVTNDIRGRQDKPVILSEGAL
jgi:hypothetical protein